MVVGDDHRACLARTPSFDLGGRFRTEDARLQVYTYDNSATRGNRECGEWRIVVSFPIVPGNYGNCGKRNYCSQMEPADPREADILPRLEPTRLDN